MGPRWNWPRWLMAAAGLLMLLAGLLPVMEIMGESASLIRLAWGGFSPPWTWMLAGSGALALLGAASASPMRAAALGLAAAATPLAIACILGSSFGISFLGTLRTGAHLLLLGAFLSLGCAIMQLFKARG